jgi:hypothetical protein
MNASFSADLGSRDALTISRRTSPEEKVSPSAFFHAEIPPSVIVGLIAGIVIFVRAFRRAELCRPIMKK